MTDETDDSSVRVLSGTHRPTAALLPQHRLRAADPGMPTGLLNTRPAPSRLESQRALDWLNFFLADVRKGVGPFIAVYLANSHWTATQVGLALTAAEIAGVATLVGVLMIADLTQCEYACCGGNGNPRAPGFLARWLGETIRPQFDEDCGNHDHKTDEHDPAVRVITKALPGKRPWVAQA